MSYLRPLQVRSASSERVWSVLPEAIAGTQGDTGASDTPHEAVVVTSLYVVLHNTMIGRAASVLSKRKDCQNVTRQNHKLKRRRNSTNV